MQKNRKLINIEEVENGFVMTYTIAGSGQQQRFIANTVAGAKDQVGLWLDKDESPPDISEESVENAEARRIAGAKY